jgi:Protein of unknown function (DUF3343)
MTSGEGCLYLFETTHQAMWAEEVAREQGIPAEVVGAPADAKAKCGLALRTATGHCGILELAMGAQGIEFRVYAPRA